MGTKSKDQLAEMPLWRPSQAWAASCRTMIKRRIGRKKFAIVWHLRRMPMGEIYRLQAQLLAASMMKQSCRRSWMWRPQRIWFSPKWPKGRPKILLLMRLSFRTKWRGKILCELAAISSLKLKRWIDLRCLERSTYPIWICPGCALFNASAEVTPSSS